MVRNVDPIEHVVQIHAPSQLVQRTSGLLDRQIDDAIGNNAASVEINMLAVDGIDSFGLNWLLAAQGRLTSSNITLRLTQVRPLIEDILIATRLNTRLNMQVAEKQSNA